MGRAQHERLRAVTPEERHRLRRIASAPSERVDRGHRALAVLTVADGQTFSVAARTAGFQSGTTVANLVRRFNQRGLAALDTGPGRGRKPTYDVEARTRIVTAAQREPDRKTDGTAVWSLSTLERSLRREALPQVGATTIRRVLQDAGSSFQRTRTWCPTGTAQRQRKAGIVTVTDPETEQKRG